LLECIHITKFYGRKRVLNDVNIKLRRGEVVGLLGPNGAGKTTIFRIILGLTIPNRGRVLLDGEDITEYPVHLRAKKGLTYLPQETSVFRNLKARDNLLLVAEMYERDPRKRIERVRRSLKEFGILDLENQRADELSGGEKRRLELARMLILNPSFTLLDEPFAGIDPLTVKEIKKLIEELKMKNIGVIVTDHNVTEICDVSDRVYVIHKGEIISHGTPVEILNDPLVIKYYLGEKEERRVVW